MSHGSTGAQGRGHQMDWTNFHRGFHRGIRGVGGKGYENFWREHREPADECHPARGCPPVAGIYASQQVAIDPRLYACSGRRQAGNSARGFAFCLRWSALRHVLQRSGSTTGSTTAKRKMTEVPQASHSQWKVIASRCGEMADAADLKSAGEKSPSGFESRYR